MTPKVSVVVPAYNLDRFLPAALDSVLAQDWPADRLELIVVDDGSTDDTPHVLDRYSSDPRVRAIRQENGGLVAAVDTGLHAASGDYIALLDADDECPPGRIARQAAMLDARPEVGLVHSDMELIDEAGNTTHPSFFEAYKKDVREGRVLGALLAGNFVSGGAAMFRASLLPALLPIDPAAAYPDWWIAANIAAVAEIATCPGSGNRYRDHDSNMGLGTGEDGLTRALAREIPWRQWMLRNLVQDEGVTAAELQAAIGSWRYGLEHVRRARGLTAIELYKPDQQARDRSRALTVEAAEHIRAGDVDRAARTLCSALGEDPWNGAALFDLDRALGELMAAPPVVAPPVTPLGAEPMNATVTVAEAGDVIEHPGLLTAYAASAGDDCTLVLVVADDSQLAPLVEAVDSAGLGEGSAVDLVAVPIPRTTPAKRLLEARAAGRTLGAAPHIEERAA